MSSCNRNNRCHRCCSNPCGCFSPSLQGPQGPAGTPGAGAIIPIASGPPVALGTVSTVANTVGLIGFGNSANTLLLAGNTVDLTGAGGTLLNMAFSVPRAGTITAISALFSTAVGIAVGTGSATITATLYRSAATNPTPNLFTAIPGASVTLTPSFDATLGIPLGSISQSPIPPAVLNIPVSAGDRLLMVFSVTFAGTGLAAITGYASAGVAIS